MNRRGVDFKIDPRLRLQKHVDCELGFRIHFLVDNSAFLVTPTNTHR